MQRHDEPYSSFMLYLIVPLQVLIILRWIPSKVAVKLRYYLPLTFNDLPAEIVCLEQKSK